MWDQWLEDPEMIDMTRAGNRRAPPPLMMIQWAREAWSRVSKDIIIKSFKKCGLSLNMDGTEDHLAANHRQSDEEAEEEEERVVDVSEGEEAEDGLVMEEVPEEEADKVEEEANQIDSDDEYDHPGSPGK